MGSRTIDADNEASVITAAGMENIAKKSDVKNVINDASDNAEPVNKTSDKAIKEIFTTFDKNGDGCVNVMEIKDLISSLGGNLSDQEATAMVKMADSDKSGDITINEFRRLWSAMQITEDEDDIKEEFERMDPNGDGYITKDELADLLRKTALIRDVDRRLKNAWRTWISTAMGKSATRSFFLYGNIGNKKRKT